MTAANGFKRREWRPYRPTRKLFLRDVAWMAQLSRGVRASTIARRDNRRVHRSRRVTAYYIEWRVLELSLLLEQFDKPGPRLLAAAKLGLGAEVWTALQMMRRRHWSFEKLLCRLRLRRGVKVAGIGRARYGHIIKIASLR